MHVDDRLATVLGARVESMAARRIQYRQLLDLVGTSSSATRDDRLDAALVRLAELAREIPADERARALGEPGVRLRNPRLVADLAGDVPAVAQAAIRAARLDDAQWLDLVPALPLAARGLLRHRRDLGPEVLDRLERLGIADRALPPAEAGTIAAAPASVQEPLTAPDSKPPVERTAEAAVTPLPSPSRPTLPPAGDGIGALVRRIEAFRRTREGLAPPQAANDAPRLPLGERDIEQAPLAAFSFATDTAGRIEWTDAAVPGMLVGARIDAGAPGLRDLLRHRLPLRGDRIPLAGAPAVAGDWLVEALPEFDHDGRYTGYLGRFRRPPAAGLAAPSEADRMRQVLHELKTPVNAIQGFAEVIQQQLFGATPHEYRALAAAIAGDAARLLAGFDELDRWARLDAGVLAPEAGTSDFAMVVAGLVHQLEGYTLARSSGFTFTADAGEVLVPLAPVDAERLAWRLLASCAGAASPGEMLALTLNRAGDRVRLCAALPSALRDVSQPAEAPTMPAVQAISAGTFGIAFTFRLLCAEARGAGGSLEFHDGVAILELPAADQQPGLTSGDAPSSPAAYNSMQAGH